MRGFELYRGKSLLDGSKIVCLASLTTANRKTGPMIQVWVLQADMSPQDAIQFGLDRGVCGDCPLVGERIEGEFRGHPLGASPGRVIYVKNRLCYVDLKRGPKQVWRAWKNGRYVRFTRDFAGLTRGRSVRLGAFGEIVAVPRQNILRFLDYCGGTVTGYTHQWRRLGRRSKWRYDIHASTHSAEESLLANDMGWTVYQSGGKPVSGYSRCGSPRITCENCGGCAGNKGWNVYGKISGRVTRKTFDREITRRAA